MDKICGNELEGNQVPLGERKLDCTLTKEPQNFIFHICVIWGYYVQNSTTQTL